MKVLDPSKFRSRMFSAALITCCLPLILFLAGCGTTVTASGGASPTAPSVALAATPDSVAVGASSVLNVTAANATTVVITGSDGSKYSMPGTGGSQSVTPSATTTYTATATGAAGTTPATASVKVTVTAAAAATVTISANPTSVAPGASSTLTVAAMNATAVTISGSDGTSYTLSVTGGTQIVKPTATTTYTASAVGVTGSAPVTAQAVVTVTSAVNTPTITITASPSSIAPGSTSTLTVNATNATSVVITGSDNSHYTLTSTGGTQSVSPSATTTYTATATGAAGTSPATASVQVTVTSSAAATVTISANPTTVASGASSTLTVMAANATAVTISGSDGTTYSLPVTGGTQVVKPSATTTYTASAAGAAGAAPVTAQAVVTVTSAVNTPSITITASPSSITPGSNSTLTVSATNATSVVITGSDNSHYTLTSTGGTQSVSPSATTTYTATATGAAGTTPATASVQVTVTAAQSPTVSITSNQASIIVGSSAVLNVTATNATSVTITGSDSTTYTLSSTGGSQTVSPATTTTYTATATGATGTTPASASVTVTVMPAATLQSVKHVVMMLQENHTFDNYFGMLNPYRVANSYNMGTHGETYAVDGIDDKLTISNQDDELDPPFSLFKFKSTCIDDLTSAWLESYGDVSRYDFTTTRPILMDGFVHTAEGFTSYCSKNPGKCSGTFSDLRGKRAMGYYDENFLNYYYYMASQFALSDRWFSPVSSKSISNRLATYTGGTTQGLVSDPGNDDNLPQLGIKTIFSKLTANNVTWKIYYTSTDGGCLYSVDCSKNPAPNNSPYPSTDFTYFSDANQYLTKKTPTNPTCPPGLSDSTAVGDSSSSFCIDTTHVAPLSQYFADAAAGTLPSFSFIEAGYGINDEHPGSGNSVLNGQIEVAKVVNSLMSSPSWKDSAFFMAYDEGGGPYDHVPPVPGKSNNNTDATVGSTPVGSIPDISAIAVDADGPSHPYYPCVPTTVGNVPTTHCDLSTVSPGAHPTDAAAVNGFTAQLGFRVPNMIISPFIKKHYVGHTPMDHTAILKFVEDDFLPGQSHFTPRVAAQPDLLDFFDFNTVPWATPPSPPTPYSDNGATCTPMNF